MKFWIGFIIAFIISTMLVKRYREKKYNNIVIPRKRVNTDKFWKVTDWIFLILSLLAMTLMEIWTITNYQFDLSVHSALIAFAGGAIFVVAGLYGFVYVFILLPIRLIRKLRHLNAEQTQPKRCD